MADLAGLTNAALVERLKALLVKECRLEVELLAHIAELDERKLYAELGFDSLFRYCVEELGLSESVAGHRIHAARAARRFPRVYEDIAQGRIHLSGIVVLAPHLTPNNHERILDAVAGRSRRDIEELVATMFPKADAPAAVSRVPDQLALAGKPRRTRKERATVEPLRPERYKVQFTADRELRDQLEEAQALLRHQIPDGDLAEIFRRAIGLLLDESKRKRFAKTERPREKKASANPSRAIPAEIKRAVYERDGGRCTYAARNGRRCGSRDFLEYHHEAPWAVNGRHSEREITLRCRAHNLLAACADYGADFMRRCQQSPGTVPDPPGRM